MDPPLSRGPHWLIGAVASVKLRPGREGQGSLRELRKDLSRTVGLHWVQAGGAGELGSWEHARLCQGQVGTAGGWEAAGAEGAGQKEPLPLPPMCSEPGAGEKTDSL